MATKTVEVDRVGTVHIVKSSRNRNIRLSITAKGPRVSLPFWLPYSAGIAFAQKHEQWIRKHLRSSTSLVVDQMKIGKLHRVHFNISPDATQAVRTRITATKITIAIPPGLNPEDVRVQTKARAAIERALKKEATQLLPLLTKKLAAEHGFDFTSVTTKKLQRRWGSCDQRKQLTYNIYLMQLPWSCIEYVVLHELCHTQHMHHQDAFWKSMKRVCPRYLDIRRQMKQYQPTLESTITII